LLFTYFVICQVKPALPYSDVIRLLRDNSSLPIAAYQVILLFFLLLFLSFIYLFLFIYLLFLFFFLILGYILITVFSSCMEK
jgi:Delta-aminolevulinic acid dehydratase